VSVIGESLEILFSIANDLLDYSRKDKLEKEGIDIEKLVEMVVRESEKKVLKNSVKVEKEFADKMPLFYGDKLKIHQVLVNIVDNAVQAMPDGGVLRIITSYSEGVKNHISIIVADTGCGIDRDSLEKIFVPFFTTKKDGTGLGLPIVKHFVELHGGELFVKSEAGKGTEITVSLPCRQ